MRRATLRIMLESSTIRQVFILSSLHYRCAWHIPPHLRGHSNSREIERAVGVKRDKNRVVEAKHARCHGAQYRVEIARGRLAIAIGEAEHFADAVHQNAERFRPSLNADDHMRIAGRIELKPAR